MRTSQRLVLPVTACLLVVSAILLPLRSAPQDAVPKMPAATASESASTPWVLPT
jgi:hypothetical protein